MKQVTLEAESTTKLFWILGALLFGVIAWSAQQKDPGVYAGAVVLLVVTLFPLYLWLIGWSRGLPLWPMFALITGLTMALPMVQDPVTLAGYTQTEVIVGGMTTAGFILFGSFVWLAATGREPKAPKMILMITREHSERYLFAFILSGIAFQLNQIAWWVNFPGNSMQVVRGITMSLNTMGIFVLAYYHGKGLLARRNEVMLAVLVAVTTLLGASGLILAAAIIPAAMYMLGLALGSGKVPWKALLVIFLTLAVLHPGKYEMRNVYWGESDRRWLTLQTLPAFYTDWLTYGLEDIGILKTVGPQVEEEDQSSIFERGGNLHMLLLVQQKSPREVPFLNGITYEHIPRLLLPRFIDSGKGISHAGNVLLTVNYGLQNLEQTATTSIGWGLLPEAYANFGYLGVGMLAAALGVFYGLAARLTVGVPMTSLRFVIGLLILAASTRADTMGIFVSSQFQGIVGVSVAALFLMKRQRNPFAPEVEGEYLRRSSPRAGRPDPAGLPAPGILAGLIEGQSVRSSDSQAGEGSGGDHPAVAPKEADDPSADSRQARRRIPKWLPRSHRRAFALAAARSEAEKRDAKSGADGESRAEPKKPRQVAVPIQPYYYRSRKA